ncbi:uncharacterized protein G2W53_026919 [Senna tora]|uniref:Uncharacterized protein n=1 Tax=Senna tora TaxID=362788 RepID=A0A834WLT6_9FABA|nr:uncharacterized protein G2W53_026919 [Senna tora]
MDDDVVRRRCICRVKMKPMTQGNLPRSFKAIRLARNQIFDGRRLGSSSVVDVHMLGQNEAYETSKPANKFQGNLTCARPKIFDGRRRGSPSVGDTKKPITHGKPPKKFQGDPNWSPGDRPRGSTSQIQLVVGQLFFNAKSQVHMVGQNGVYDTRKPPKKFQGNPTCARPNIRWTTTWIAVGCERQKINHPWLHMLGENEAYDTWRPPRKSQGNLTCAWPNLRWTTTWIAVDQRRSKINHPWVNFFSMPNLTCIFLDKMIPLTQGSFPRCFKVIRVTRPAVDHVDLSIKNHLGHKETSQEVSRQSDLRAAKCSVDDDVDRRRLQHKATSQEVSRQSDLRAADSSMGDDVDRRWSETVKNQSPMAYVTRKAHKKFQGNPTCARPNLRWMTTWIAVGWRLSKINHRWVNFSSMENLTCICSDKMIPMTQGSLPRSFKAIRIGHPAVDHVDRRPKFN